MPKLVDGPEHRFPPNEPGDPEFNNRPPHGWTCFHCGETFTTIGGAQDHFGADPDSVPGCILKVQFGGERGMLQTMRRIEVGLTILRAVLNEENWNIDEGPGDAVSRAWNRVIEIQGLLQQWRLE